MVVSLADLVQRIQLAQPPFQALIADIMGLALADYSLNEFRDYAVRRQNGGAKGQVFILHGLLKTRFVKDCF